MTKELTQYEQVLSELFLANRAQVQSVTVNQEPKTDTNEWIGAIGLRLLLKMSAAAATNLARHRFPASEQDKQCAAIAYYVVFDLLRDLDSLGSIEGGLQDKEDLHKALVVLKEFHKQYPNERHCDNDRSREIAAEGILPLVKRITLSEVFGSAKT